MRLTRIALCCSLLAAAMWPVAAVHAGEQVTIYRCTDAKGHTSLRDSPCPQGQQQQTRTMVKPKDAPRTLPRTTVRAAREPVAAPAPQVFIINTPRPMYECITPDGTRYTSESPEGNPRWVPLWTMSYPVLTERTIYQPGGGYVRYDDGKIDAGIRSGSLHREVVPTAAGYGAGTWIRDQCSALPQAETCDRLRDRRSAIRTRFFNAMPSERDRLNLEERGINARLDADCGGR